MQECEAKALVKLKLSPSRERDLHHPSYADLQFNAFSKQTSPKVWSVLLLTNAATGERNDGLNSFCQSIHKTSVFGQPIHIERNKMVFGRPCQKMSLKTLFTIFRIGVLITSFCSSWHTAPSGYNGSPWIHPQSFCFDSRDDTSRDVLKGGLHVMLHQILPVKGVT